VRQTAIFLGISESVLRTAAKNGRLKIHNNGGSRIYFEELNYWLGNTGRDVQYASCKTFDEAIARILENPNAAAKLGRSLVGNMIRHIYSIRDADKEQEMETIPHDTEILGSDLARAVRGTNGDRRLKQLTDHAIELLKAWPPNQNVPPLLLESLALALDRQGSDAAQVECLETHIPEDDSRDPDISRAGWTRINMARAVLLWMRNAREEAKERFRQVEINALRMHDEHLLKAARKYLNS
jgi:hypothetical protein